MIFKVLFLKLIKMMIGKCENGYLSSEIDQRNDIGFLFLMKLFKMRERCDDGFLSCLILFKDDVEEV